MFAWAAIPEGYTDDVSFVMELLERAGVLCTPGSSFGKRGKGHVRFALTMPVERIKEAVKAIENSGMIRKYIYMEDVEHLDMLLKIKTQCLQLCKSCVMKTEKITR